MQLYKRGGGDSRNGVTCGASTEALTEAAEDAEDVDGKLEKSRVFSRSPTEKIVFRQVRDKEEEGAKNVGHMKEKEKELVGCGVYLRPRAWPWRHTEEGMCQELGNRGLCVPASRLLGIGGRRGAGPTESMKVPT